MTDWSAMVRQHGPLVWRTVFRVVGNEADAADAFQETFVSAIEYSQSRSVANWPGLLRRLATARAIECLRRRVRRNRVQRPFDDGVDISGSMTPDRAAATQELVDDLRTALAEMEPRQAEAFCLAHLDAVPYRDVADQLGVSVSHAGVLIHRARAALRERLGQYDPFPAEESTP